MATEKNKLNDAESRVGVSDELYGAATGKPGRWKEGTLGTATEVFRPLKGRTIPMTATHRKTDDATGKERETLRTTKPKTADATGKGRKTQRTSK